MPLLVDKRAVTERHVAAYNGEDVSLVPHINPARKLEVSVINTAGPVTYTPAQIMGGYIRRDPNGGPRTDLFPSAAAFLAAVPGAFVGQFWDVVFQNDGDTAGETITWSAAVGSGVTIVGTTTAIINNSRRYTIFFTAIGSSPAYTAASRGSFTT